MWGRFVAVLAVTSLASCTTVTPNGPSMSASNEATPVAITAEFVGFQCSGIQVSVAVKTAEGYKHGRPVPVRYGNDLPDTPYVLTMEPGEYHIVDAVCTIDEDLGKSVTIRLVNQGGLSLTHGFREPNYQGFASFKVTPARLLNIGQLKIYLDGDKVARLEVVDLPPHAHSVLKQNHPEAYARMETRKMVAETEGIGKKVNAMRTEVRRGSPTGPYYFQRYHEPH
jgi:hypothetical protein